MLWWWSSQRAPGPPCAPSQLPFPLQEPNAVKGSAFISAGLYPEIQRRTGGNVTAALSDMEMILNSLKPFKIYSQVLGSISAQQALCGSTDVTQWPGCIVGNVGSRLGTGQFKNKWTKSIQLNWRYHLFLYTHAPVLKPIAYITHNASQPLSDITGGWHNDTLKQKTCQFNV